MTVSSEANQNLHTGNDVADTFPYTFKILSEEHLRVVQADTDDVETELVLNVDYTVTGVGEDLGGDITLTAGPLPTGYDLSIRRFMPILQSLDLLNQGDINAENLEEAYDYAIMVLQQQQNEIDRSVKVAETSGLSGDDILDLIDTAVTDSQAAAAAAAVSEANAATSASNAATSETNAATSASNAATSEANAATSATAAQTAQTAAEVAQAAAEAAKSTWEKAEINIQSDNYTVLSTDAGKWNALDSATGKQFDLPAISANAECVFHFANINTGVLTFAPNGGDTSEITTLEENESVTLIADNVNNVWRIQTSDLDDIVSSDEQVKVSSNDTNASYLEEKIVAGQGIDVSTLNDGLDEDFQISHEGNFLVSANDTTPGFLNGKLVAGTNTALTENNDGGNETLSVSAIISNLEGSIKADNYVVLSSDFGKLLLMNNASPKAFTLPDIVGNEHIALKNIGAGLTTITPDGSDTTEIASLQTDDSVILWGDGTNNKWRVVAATGTAAGGGSMAFLKEVDKSEATQTVPGGTDTTNFNSTGVEIIASTAADIKRIDVIWTFSDEAATDGTDWDNGFIIYTGAGNVPAYSAAGWQFSFPLFRQTSGSTGFTANSPQSLSFDVDIPAGTRIAGAMFANQAGVILHFRFMGEV